MQACDGTDPLREIEEQLARDDPALAHRMGRSVVRALLLRLALSGALVAGGLLLLLFETRSVGIGAVFAGSVLIFAGGYDIPMRIFQVRRQREYQSRRHG